MGDWKRNSIAGGPSPHGMSPPTPNHGGVMGDWKRNSIAGGPSPQGMSPATPNQDIAGALHLDFFFRAGASRTASSRDGGRYLGSTREVGAAITPSRPRGSTSTITDGTLRQPGAGSNGADRTTLVAPPVPGAPPSRKRRRSRASAPCPPFTMLSTISEHGASTFVDNEDGDHWISGHGGETEESMREEAMLALYSEEEEQQQQQQGEDVQEEEKEEEKEEEEAEEEDEEQQQQEEDDVQEEVKEEEEEEEEEPVSPDECVECGSSALVKLIPCRHAWYCADCFPAACRDGRCPVCGVIWTRVHHQSAGLLRPSAKKRRKKR